MVLMAGALGVILDNEAILRMDITQWEWQSRDIENLFILITDFDYWVFYNLLELPNQSWITFF